MTPVRVSWVHSLLEEHHALLEYVARLEKTIDTSTTAVDRTQLLWLLGEIDEHLASHMTLEEQDGYLNVVRERLPNRTEVVEHLQGQHAELRAGLSAVIKTTESAASAQHLENDVVPAVREWIQALRAHEDDENSLMQEAFNADYGGSGD